MMGSATVARREAIKSATLLVLPTLLIAISLGVLSGWLTGRTGPDHAVTAAAIPAILALVGGFGFVQSAREGNFTLLIQLAVFVLTFCLSFYGALRHGAYEKAALDLEKEAIKRENAEQAYRAHFDHLEECSKRERFSNAIRRYTMGLDALGPEYFCRKAPNSLYVVTYSQTSADAAEVDAGGSQGNTATPEPE